MEVPKRQNELRPAGSRRIERKPSRTPPEASWRLLGVLTSRPAEQLHPCWAEIRPGPVGVTSVVLCNGRLPVNFRYAPSATEIAWRRNMSRRASDCALERLRVSMLRLADLPAVLNSSFSAALILRTAFYGVYPCRIRLRYLVEDRHGHFGGRACRGQR
jgi:hypothetical protein